MEKVQYQQMSDKGLLRYIATHRDQPEAIEARRTFIRRLKTKVEAKGLQFERPYKGESNANKNIAAKNMMANCIAQFPYDS